MMTGRIGLSVRWSRNNSASSPLKEWRFLIDAWKGKTDGNQFDVKETIERYPFM
jgi:hypothetical protein